MGINIEMVRERYAKMTNEELIQTATEDAAGLTPEAVDVVKSEIKKRGLDSSLALDVEAQNRQFSVEEVEAYCDLLSNLDCPGCGETSYRLNATITAEVTSIIVVSQYKSKLKIGCASCLNKANNDALLKTVLLGWWGFPWGIIYTFRAIVLNIKNKKAGRSEVHNEILKQFVVANAGLLERYQHEPAALQQIIGR